MQPTHPLIPADRVNGTTVYTRQGDKIGSIEDVAIEKVSGDVAYAIIGTGGFLGMGERYYPVPWSMLTFDVERRGYVIPLDKDQLEKAPSIDASELSGWSDESSRETLAGYYTPLI